MCGILKPIGVYPYSIVINDFYSAGGLDTNVSYSLFVVLEMSPYSDAADLTSVVTSRIDDSSTSGEMLEALKSQRDECPVTGQLTQVSEPSSIVLSSETLVETSSTESPATIKSASLSTGEITAAGIAATIVFLSILIAYTVNNRRQKEADKIDFKIDGTIKNIAKEYDISRILTGECDENTAISPRPVSGRVESLGRLFKHIPGNLPHTASNPMYATSTAARNFIRGNAKLEEAERQAGVEPAQQRQKPLNTTQNPLFAHRSTKNNLRSNDSSSDTPHVIFAGTDPLHRKEKRSGHVQRMARKMSVYPSKASGMKFRVEIDNSVSDV